LVAGTDLSINSQSNSNNQTIKQAREVLSTPKITHSQ